jgi:hypothetical protein
MQQYKIQSVSDISRHTFKKLVTLWLTIMFLTVAAGFLVAVGSAKADVLLPIPKAQMVIEPAVLQHFSSSPSPAIIQQRCATHIHPQDKSVGFLSVSSRSQRNAETQGLQTIMAIKAYRQCVSQIALDQLASK